MSDESVERRARYGQAAKPLVDRLTGVKRDELKIFGIKDLRPIFKQMLEISFSNVCWSELADHWLAD